MLPAAAAAYYGIIRYSVDQISLSELDAALPGQSQRSLQTVSSRQSSNSMPATIRLVFAKGCHEFLAALSACDSCEAVVGGPVVELPGPDRLPPSCVIVTCLL